MSARPEIVYDGADELDRTVVPTCTRPCPWCHGPVEFDPVSVVSIGRSIAWATSEAVVSLQDHVLAALTFTVDEFDGRRTVRSLDGCSPYVDLLTCPSCERTLLAVVSYGEVQPARWRLVVDGLIGGQDA